MTSPFTEGDVPEDAIEVKFPGGKPPLYFPKDTPQEEIDRVSRNYHLGLFKPPAQSGEQPAAQPGVWDRVDRAAKVVGSGLNKGAAAIAGLPRTLGDAFRRSPGAQVGVDALLGMLPGDLPEKARAARDEFNRPSNLPTAEDVSLKLDPLLPRVQPEGAGERILEGFGQAGVIPHPAMMVPAVGSALLGEGARQGARLLGMPEQEQNAETVGRTIGGFLTIGGQRALVPSAHEMVRDATRGVTRQGWADAQRLETDARGLGVPLLGPESIEAPALRRLAADTRAHPTGGVPMDDALRNRPAQLDAAASRASNAVGPRQDPAQVAQALQDAAEEVLARAQRGLSARARPFYDAAEATPLPAADVAAITAQLRARAVNTSADVSRELEGLASRLEANPTIGAIHAELRQFRELGETAGSIGAADRAASVKAASARAESSLGQADRAMENADPNFAVAQDLYRRNAPIVEAQRRGPVGQLATRNPEELGNVKGTVSRQEQILTSPEATSPGTIRTVARELNGTNPMALRDFTAEYLRRTWDAASKAVQSGPNLMAGANWRKALYATPRQQENVRALLEESARATGQSPAGVVAGFDRLMDVMERTGTIPGMGSPTASRGANYARAAEGDVKGALLQAQPVDPLAPLRRWRQRVWQEKQFTELGELFSRPDSVRALKDLAMTAPRTRKEQLAVQALLSTSSVADQLSEGQ